MPTEPVATRTLPPVDVGEEGRFESGLVATVEEVVPVRLDARGPGEVAGPGHAVVLELENGSSAPVDLAGVAVSATSEDGTPAVPSSSSAAEPLTGALEPGGTARGTYVFAAPEGASLRIQVEQNEQGDVVVVGP
ncbi:hypothetical protein [uncultured Pseudokineococcus sp.]|uniref:hypothetical protein n=1 Tax=uncultured Pseudokineococcus sp. TaxID=1642928 RepID=UPI00262A6532|nr:hypothetical protein [uncultured Pseudokineococcus sp.]